MFRPFISMQLWCVIIVLLYAQKAAAQSASANASPVAAGATLQLISDQFSFTEGPAADKAGNVYFTDQPNNRIWKYSINGRLSLFMDSAGRANGMYFDDNDHLIVCADANNELWQISLSGKVKVLIKDVEGKRLNGPNDVWVSASGDLYITDPYYQRTYWQRTKPELHENVYLLKKGATQLQVVEDSLQKPNGIIGTRDGRYLYVSDLQGGKTYRYSISRDGTLQQKTLFVQQGSDGMAIDNRGNVYLSGKGVTVYNNAGEKIAQIPVPADWTGNVCFGGKNRDILFITAGKSLFTLKMGVKGAE